MKIVALDIGEKRIGVAISSENSAVFPLQTIFRKNLEQDLETILEVIQEYSLKKLVVGFPYNMDGTESAQSKKIKNFVKILEKFLKEKNVDLSIEFADERLTSWEAREKLSGKKAKKNKEAIDAIAACLILEDYLARRTE